MEKFKNILKSKITIICFVVFIIILGFVIYINNSRKVTKLEKVMIQEYSDKYSDYYDEILDNSDNKCRHINFVLEYLLNTEEIKSVSTKEVKKYINEILGIDYDYNDLVNLAAIDNRIKAGFTYSIEDKMFRYNSKVTRTDIIKKSLVKYEIKSIKRKGNNKFVVTYKKYEIKNPYDLYNYYNDLNINKKSDEKKEDITDIAEYLKGSRKTKDVKRFITKECVKKIGTIKNIKIEYELKNDKLVLVEKSN